MLIDFITARVELERFSETDQARLKSHGERICKFSPATGEVSWDVSTWDSVRSDSHQISVRVTPDCLMVKGSPARVIGDGDAAFSSGAARALDLPGCMVWICVQIFALLLAGWRRAGSRRTSRRGPLGLLRNRRPPCYDFSSLRRH